MTTQSTVPSTGVTEASAGLSYLLTDLEDFLNLARQQWQWLFILIPYAAAWWIPVSWVRHEWGSPSNVLFFQSWVPVLTLLLFWSRRDRLYATYQAVKNRNDKNLWRRGNPLVFALGFALLLFAHLVQIKGIAIIGLILTGIGIIYHVFGTRILQVLTPALLFFLLCVPPPDTVADRLQNAATSFTLKTVCSVLRLFHVSAFIGSQDINYPDYGYAVYFGAAGGGLGPVALSAAISLWYGLYTRRPSPWTLLLVFTGVALSFLLNAVRIMIAGGVYGTSRQLSAFLAGSPVIYLVVAALSCLGMLFMDRLLIAHLLRTRESRKAVGATGAGGSGRPPARKRHFRLFNPFAFLGMLWKRSEKGLEKLLKRLTPKRRRGNRF